MDIRRLTILTAALAMTACSSMPNRISSELEHVSHPLAGWPINASNNEDGLSQANVIARWENGRFYVEHGLGWNVQGENGGGFYGPELTYTGRVGMTLWSKQ